MGKQTWMEVAEASRHARVTAQALYQWIEAGQIKTRRNGKTRVRPAQVSLAQVMRRAARRLSRSRLAAIMRHFKARRWAETTKDGWVRRENICRRFGICSPTLKNWELGGARYFKRVAGGVFVHEPTFIRELRRIRTPKGQKWLRNAGLA
jgi:hypothetical protein